MASVWLVSSAWFGLIGVAVGALFSTLWSWFAVVRQEIGDAVVAARLIDEDLRALQAAPTSRRAPHDTDVWRENRAALAKALGHGQWDAVASVYRHDPTVTGDPIKHVPAARKALAGFAASKRSAARQRVRNFLACSSSRNGV